MTAATADPFREAAAAGLWAMGQVTRGPVSLGNRLSYGPYEHQVGDRFAAFVSGPDFAWCEHLNEALHFYWFLIPGCPLGCQECTAGWMVKHCPPGCDDDSRCDICGAGPNKAGTWEQRQLIERLPERREGEPPPVVTVTYGVCRACLAAEGRKDPAAKGWVEYPTVTGADMIAMQPCFSAAEEAKHLSACARPHRKKLAAEFTRLRRRDAEFLAATDPAKLDPAGGVGWGDCWTASGDHIAASLDPFVHRAAAWWGRVLPLMEVMDGEFSSRARHARDELAALAGRARLAADEARLGAELDAEAWRQALAQEAEVQAIIDAIRETYRAGWRHCWVYSAAEPAGVLGYVHVRYLTKITAAEFAAAQAAGWQQ